MGVRERQPAPVLRRGLEDDRLRDGRAARLGAARPGRLPDRLGLAVHEDRPRLREWIELGLVDGELPAFNGAQADGLQPGRRGVRRRARGLPARSGRTRSPRASRSATRPTASTRSSSRAGPAARSSRSPTTRSAPGSGCSPRPRACSPRPPAASPPRCWRSSPRRARSPTRERVVVVITGEGLKTLDAVRDGFEITEIEPTLDVVRGAVRAGDGARRLAPRGAR